MTNEVLTASTSGLSSPTQDNGSDEQAIQVATEGLLGLARGNGRDGDAIYSAGNEGDDEDEDEDEDEEEEEEEEVKSAEHGAQLSTQILTMLEFSLEFSVPVNAAVVDTISISSSIEHSTFFQQIAEEMGVRRRDMNIAYKFSTWTAKTPPRLLKTPEHLDKLFDNAKKEIGARNQKPEKKAEKKAASSKNSRNKRRDSDSDDSNNERPKEKTKTDHLRDLESTHKCERHGGFCVVAANGEHIKLSTNNISLWSLLLAEGVHKSTTEPPDILQLPLKTGTQATPSSRRLPSNFHPPPPHPYPFYPPPGPYPPPYYPTPTAPVLDPPAPQQAAKLKPASSIDSQEEESPTLFPKIDDWLLDLDTSERGEDGHGFTKFGPTLRANGYMRIIQLVDEGKDGAEMLRTMCSENGMTSGVAKLLMKYAVADCKKIRKAEVKRKEEWARRD
ncbi:hypothetical protein B0H11DRAFT_2297918 [Mycena galericulata]|nr:hypothetical protein B0H11DRAFT_2297918 [Mycena galericulata]